jgi:peptidoglycan hydrolase-like protein with peptidoglycan-binding domain
MRPLTAYWIGIVIVLAVLNGIRALPAGSRARRSMRSMGIVVAVLGILAIIALKSGSQNANSPSTPDVQQAAETNTSIVVPDDTIAVQSRLIDLGYMSGTPDGLWGNRSRLALRAFKAANGIRADDKWDSEISAKLFSTQAARSPTSAAGSVERSRQKVN